MSLITQDELRCRLTAQWGEPRSGKVRDIYDMGDKLLMISSDRISVYNHQLRQSIKDKGRLLNGISAFWFKETKDIVANHVLARPDPAAFIVEKCTPILVEVVMRRYMVGSLWKDYSAGKRIKCGIILPEFLEENQRLTYPIITPTFKSHDDPDATTEELIQQGILYFGLMVTEDGIYLLEYNCRFGDPEAQAILPLLKTDLASIMIDCINGHLKSSKITWSDQYTCCVVMASEGYPFSFPTGDVVTGFEKVPSNVLVFHAGTKMNGANQVVTSGGRVLGVTGIGDTLKDAVAAAYNGVRLLDFVSAYYRRDIAYQALEK